MEKIVSAGMTVQ